MCHHYNAIAHKEHLMLVAEYLFDELKKNSTLHMNIRLNELIDTYDTLCSNKEHVVPDIYNSKQMMDREKRP